MRKLPVDLGDIADLMGFDRMESEPYLDLHTGKTFIISSDLLDLEEEDEEGIPGWQKNDLRIAREIAQGSARYVLIPEPDTHEDYNLMVRFAETVTNKRLRELLAVALNGQGAFRRFTGVLADNPDEQKRWYAAKDAEALQCVRAWLHEIGIEPVEKKP